MQLRNPLDGAFSWYWLQISIMISSSENQTKWKTAPISCFLEVASGIRCTTEGGAELLQRNGSSVGCMPLRKMKQLRRVIRFHYSCTARSWLWWSWRRVERQGREIWHVGKQPRSERLTTEKQPFPKRLRSNSR